MKQFRLTERHGSYYLEMQNSTMIIDMLPISTVTFYLDVAMLSQRNCYLPLASAWTRGYLLTHQISVIMSLKMELSSAERELLLLDYCAHFDRNARDSKGWGAFVGRVTSGSRPLRGPPVDDRSSSPVKVTEGKITKTAPLSVV